MPTEAKMTRLYTGEGDLASELRRMVREGRRVVERETVRWQDNRRLYNGEAIGKRTNVNADDVRRRDLLSDPLYERVNRSRQFVDGRVNSYAANKPAFKVDPPSQDQTLIDASRAATKFVAAMWGPHEWDIASKARKVATWAEVDGVGVWCVLFDPAAEKEVPIGITADGKVVSDRAQLESLREQDPQAQTLWREEKIQQGDISFRCVRPGSLSIDPLAVDDPDDARWIIESRVIGRSEAERRYGVRLKDILMQSQQMASGKSMPQDGGRSLPDVVIDDGYGGSDSLRRRDAVIVHTMFMRPCAEWLEGAHIEWLDVAPEILLLEEPWKHRLPFFFFIPRPGPSHFLSSRGTMDEIRGLQRYFDRLLAMLRRYMDRVGNPTWALPKGSLVGDSVYSERGYFEYHPALGEPHQAITPGEPASIITQHLGWCVEQMGEMANLPPVARGQAPGQGVDAAVALRYLGEQQEQQMTSTAAQFTAFLERAISWALEQVGYWFKTPRLISSPGMDDAVEVQSFSSETIRGCTAFRVTGSVLPQQRSAELQTAMQFLQILGPQVMPYMSGYIKGDVSELVASVEADAQRQRRETKKIIAAGSDPRSPQFFEMWMADMKLYAQALAGAAGTVRAEPSPDGMMMVPVPVSPEQVLAERGIFPPQLFEVYRMAGIEIPMAEDFDVHDAHIAWIDNFRKSDAGDDLPKWTKQLLNEHSNSHKKMMGAQLSAMQAQKPQPTVPQGSEPAPKGTPSPPKQPGATTLPTPRPIGAPN